MATGEEYQAAIRKLGRKGLSRLWGQIEAGNTPRWAPGKAFEYLVLRLFEIERADVKYPFEVSLMDKKIEQVDGVVYADGLSVIVEAKDTQAPQNVEPITKLRSQLLRRPASAIGAVFSRGGFTDGARLLAQFVWPQTILLWFGQDIEWSLRNGNVLEALRRKYHMAVENGMPDFIASGGS